MITSAVAIRKMKPKNRKNGSTSSELLKPTAAAVGNPARNCQRQMRAEDHAEHGHQGVEIFVASLEQIIGEQDAHGKQDEHHLRQEQAAAVLLHECLESR